MDDLDRLFDQRARSIHVPETEVRLAEQRQAPRVAFDRQGELRTDRQRALERDDRSRPESNSPMIRCQLAVASS